jgi:uncharacterized protein (DUF427 family)
MTQLRAKDRDQEVRIEPSPRWIRVKFGGETVADSRRTLLVWDDHFIPVYFFPREDVRTDLLEERQAEKGKQTTYDVVVGDRRAENGAYSYTAPDLARIAIEEYVAFRWNEMDHWYEEDEEVFVHPRDPHKRIDIRDSSRHVRVEVDGVTVAETTRPTLLFETGLPVRYYMPREDVNMAYLEPTDHVTRCPYKGTASDYWTVRAGETEIENGVWSYPDPMREEIAGLLCFYNEKVDLYVDGELQE